MSEDIPLVPKLRFPEFEGQWEPCRLADLVDPERKITYGIVQPGEFVETGVPLVRGGDYSGAWTDLASIKRVSAEIDKPYKRSKLKEGDLLLTIVGANTGNVAVVPKWLEGANITQTTARIAVKPGEAAGFVEQFLKSRGGKKEVYKHLKGAAQPGLNLSDIEKFYVPCPVKAERHKIAQFLGAVDEQISLLERRRTALKAYRSGLIRRILLRDIRFSRDDGTPFPEWTECTLEDLLLYQQPTPYLVTSTEYADEFDTPVLTAGKTFILGYTDEKDEIYDENLPVIIFDDFTTDSKLVDFPFKVKSSAIKILRKRRSDDQILVIFELLRMVKFRKGEHKRYWISEFQDMKVRLPHPDEQTKIAALLSIMDSKIDIETKHLNEARLFKTGLLQKMFV